MAFFEVSPHPEHSEERLLASMRLLDSTVRALNLTIMDLHNPASSVFPKELPPMVHDEDSATLLVSFRTRQVQNVSNESIFRTDKDVSTCGCSYGKDDESLSRPPREADWSEATINQDLGRLLCWSR